MDLVGEVGRLTPIFIGVTVVSLMAESKVALSWALIVTRSALLRAGFVTPRNESWFV